MTWARGANRDINCSSNATPFIDQYGVETMLYSRFSIAPFRGAPTEKFAPAIRCAVEVDRNRACALYHMETNFGMRPLRIRRRVALHSPV
jgi:hypothetical protein